MRIPFKSDPVEFLQGQLFPGNLFDLLPQDHECFIYGDIFRQLDTSSVEMQFSMLGQNAYHPRLIVGILIYAYSQGIFSSRKIEKKCREDLGFMYISHMNCPNFRVLSDFRKNHYDFFKDCFVQSALLARDVGLVSLGHVSFDGSKFQANTSKHKAMNYKHIKEKEEELVEEIEALMQEAKACDEGEDEEYKEKSGYEIPEELKIKKKRLAKIQEAKKALEQREHDLNPDQEIPDNKQISFSDTEARIMGKKGNFDYCYNGQISVDEDSQIIVGQHLSQAANDKKEVEPTLQEMQETMGALPSKVSADNGYLSGNNLQALEDAEVDAYVATGREGKTESPLEASNRAVLKSDCVYHEEEDCFVCPGGHTLEVASTSKDGKKIYQATQEACSGCEYQSRCCKSKKGAPRTIHTDDKEPLRQDMIHKMQQEASKDTYKKRKTIVEPVFGHIKNSGFRRFSVRGHKKASGEFSLVCAVHNFKKIVRALVNGVVCLEETKTAATVG